MASIERTAYPRFKRIIAAKKLRQAFTPSADEVALDYDADRTLRHHKALVRDRLGVLHAPEQARKLAEGRSGRPPRPRTTRPT